MSPGDVVLVRFPFTGLDSTKKRPALVLTTLMIGKRAEIVTLAMITSQIDGVKLAGDTLIAEWKRAHLLHPSLVRLAKIATLDRALIERRLGSLAGSDIASVRSGFVKTFRHWIQGSPALDS